MTGSSTIEQAPLLPHRSSSSSQQQQRRPLSRSDRIDEVRQDPNVVHDAQNEPMLPAAPVDPSLATDLHQPRWAGEQDGLDADGASKANYWARVRYVWREELAECLGTAFIILFGASVECQTTLHYTANREKPYSFGDYNSCRLAWAAGVAIAIWVSGGISGGHCNPTVTIALWLFRGFPARKVGWYIAAQVTGAMLGALIVYSNYRISIGIYEGQGLPSAIRTVTGSHATAPLFFTFPQSWLPASSAFLSEFIASGALICVVFALSDRNNLPTPKGTMAFAMFIVLVGIGASMGVNTGYALNGARDLGPRIALWLVGYGNEIWSHDHSYWIWAPWLAAISGGAAGGLVYDVFIYTGKDSFINRPISKSGRAQSSADQA